ncbi:MAG: nuclear transport factor 2 family protein [Mucilaginibacter sp.]
MKKILLLFMLAASSTLAFSQGNDNDAVKKVINRMFDAMRSADTTGLRYAFADDMVLQILEPRKDKSDSLVVEKGDDFIKRIGAPHKDAWNEKVTFGDINVNNNIATVWAPYKFYLGEKFSHCGIDVFQLMKTNIGWKIVSVFFDMRKGNCPD